MRIDPAIKRELKIYLKKKIDDKNHKVTVYSTYALSEDEFTLLKKKLPLLKESIISNEIDKEILGGIVIKFGSKMIDLSLRRELLNLKKALYERS